MRYACPHFPAPPTGGRQQCCKQEQERKEPRGSPHHGAGVVGGGAAASKSAGSPHKHPIVRMHGRGRSVARYLAAFRLTSQSSSVSGQGRPRQIVPQ